MLADYLARLKRRERPIRYASPGAAEAIRNYLYMVSRAGGLHGLHRQAFPGIRDAYSQDPRLPHAYHDLVTQDDPGALIAYLDMMGAHGFEGSPGYGRRGFVPGQSNTNRPAHEQLIDLLRSLQQGISTPGQPLRPPANVLQGFSESGLRSPAMRALLGQAQEQPVHDLPSLRHLLTTLQLALPLGEDRDNLVSARHGFLHGRDPLALTDINELSHQQTIRDHPLAPIVGQHTQDLLAHRVVPTLLGQGR